MFLMRKCAFVVMMAALFIVASVVFAAETSGDVVMSVADFFRESQENLPRFNKTYLQKHVIVEGFIKQVGGMSDGYRVYLAKDQKIAAANIFCDFATSHENRLADLNIRDKVRVKGAYATQKKFTDEPITLSECELID